MSAYQIPPHHMYEAYAAATALGTPTTAQERKERWDTFDAVIQRIADDAYAAGRAR